MCLMKTNNSYTCYTTQTINTLTGYTNTQKETVCKQVMQYKQIQRIVDKASGNTHGHVETQTNRQTDRETHNHFFHQSTDTAVISW